MFTDFIGLPHIEHQFIALVERGQKFDIAIIALSS